MNAEGSLKLQIELLWWVITGILLAAVLIPVYMVTKSYDYWIYNVIFITVTVQFSRLIFFLKHSYGAKLLWPKVLIFFLCIPLFFVILEGLTGFQRFLDEVGVQSILEHLSFEKQNYWGKYIRTEMIFFAAASLVVTLILPIRMIISAWRIQNTNKV